MPIVVVRPCNTYAPGQHPEKVIPKFVQQLLRGGLLTVYNDGHGSRDWLHATDHARAVETLLRHGVPGEAYNLAAGEEHTDLEIASRVYEVVTGQPVGIDPSTLPLRFQHGRPGHDRRYAMDGSKLRALGWAPQVPFAEGFTETVRWNLAHQDWWAHDRVEGV
jgi:dTDP-glucose 4,6-dehydratase